MRIAVPIEVVGDDADGPAGNVVVGLRSEQPSPSNMRRRKAASSCTKWESHHAKRYIRYKLEITTE